MSEKNNLPAMIEGEANPDRVKRLKWSEFAETTVLDFFGEFKLEKMSVEDGNGNKAKLSRTKDNGIKVEYSSTTIL